MRRVRLLTGREDRPVLSLRETRGVEVEDASSALLAAEYTSVRAESLESFSTSQSIIQWSLAAYGVLFGAGLIAASSDVDASLTETVAWMAAIIYGVLLPGLVIAACWSWIGEIGRMERAGVYLRGLEEHLRTATALSRSSVVAPLNWETFLDGGGGQKRTRLKVWAPYAGTAALFGGAFGSSVIFMYFWLERIIVLESDRGVGGISGWVWTLGGFSVVLVVTFLGVCIVTGNEVIELSENRYDFATRTLTRSTGSTTSRSGRRQLLLFLIAGVIAVAVHFFCLPPDLLPWRSALVGY